MTAQEYLTAAQSCAITIAFLYLTWQIPGMVFKWLAAARESALLDAEEKDKARTFQASEAEKLRNYLADRAKEDIDIRHVHANKASETNLQMLQMHDRVADKIVAAVNELAKATERMCRYNVHTNQ